MRMKLEVSSAIVRITISVNLYKSEHAQGIIVNFFPGKYCNHGIEMCFINPCRNGGSCVNVNSTSYSCTCPPGFSGAQCELTPHGM